MSGKPEVPRFTIESILNPIDTESTPRQQKSSLPIPFDNTQPEKTPTANSPKNYTENFHSITKQRQQPFTTTDTIMPSKKQRIIYNDQRKSAALPTTHPEKVHQSPDDRSNPDSAPKSKRHKPHQKQQRVEKDKEFKNALKIFYEEVQKPLEKALEATQDFAEKVKINMKLTEEQNKFRKKFDAGPKVFIGNLEYMKREGHFDESQSELTN
jgi:hypothetical protein